MLPSLLQSCLELHHKPSEGVLPLIGPLALFQWEAITTETLTLMFEFFLTRPHWKLTHWEHCSKYKLWINHYFLKYNWGDSHSEFGDNVVFCFPYLVCIMFFQVHLATQREILAVIWHTLYTFLDQSLRTQNQILSSQLFYPQSSRKRVNYRVVIQ